MSRAGLGRDTDTPGWGGGGSAGTGAGVAGRGRLGGGCGVGGWTGRYEGGVVVTIGVDDTGLAGGDNLVGWYVWV